MKELVKPISQEEKYQELLFSAMCSENNCSCDCWRANVNGGYNPSDENAEDEILF